MSRFVAIASLVAVVLGLATTSALVFAARATGGEPGTVEMVAAVRHAEKQANVYRVKYVRMKRYARKVERDNTRKTRILMHSSSVTEALGLACAVYGHCSTLWRRARCESKLDPFAHNTSGASGLLQFLGSTWRSTPFGGFSVYSPYANALAAGWMIGPAGRSGEWSCR